MIKRPGMGECGVQACNPSTREGELGESAVRGCPRLHREFKASLDYMKCISQNEIK